MYNISMENEIILKRKAYNDLLKWKNKKQKYPLIIKGLRQVGKSFLAEEFVKKEYGEKYCPILDFRHDKNLGKIFSSSFNQTGDKLKSIINNLKIYFPDKIIEKGKTCIVMDEIGDFPLARESFKIFKDNSGYDIIATGSLLGLSELNGNANDVPIGYEEYLDLKALDFEEFLWASGVNEKVITILKEKTLNFEEVPEVIHKIISEHFIRYILVGGLPRAVIKYLENNDLNEVRNYLISLRNDYEDDFGKFKNEKGETKIDSKLLVRTLRAYRSIPNQLAKENKKFKYSVIEGGGRSSEFSDALMWLEKSSLICLAYNLRAIESPLKGNKIYDEFKVYPTDIGLLMSFFPDSIVKEIINGNLGAYKGAIYEGVAADIIYKAGFDLYYYSDTKKHLENDFFIEDNDGISIIESKATNGKMASSKMLKSGNSPYVINEVFKLVSGNFGKGSFFKTIPQYSLIFLLENIKNKTKNDLKLEKIDEIIL